MTEQKLLPNFANEVLRKLRRVRDCFEDSQGADVGQKWLDVLTNLGLMKRVQRSPARWQITDAGEDFLEQSSKPAADGLPERRSYEESFTVHGQGQIMGWNACLDAVTPLVARLQGECDTLKVEVERQTTMKSNNFGVILDQQQTIRELQSELTKARELLNEISNWLVCEAIAPPEDMAKSFTPFREAIDELLAHQSTPDHSKGSHCLPSEQAIGD